jgi:2-polyprenyl-3-methyl-5-hydroxy-6-metoxy-1,4-benzoquinol methylase
MNITSSMSVKVSCPVCDADQPEFAFWTRDYTFECTEERFGMNRCAVCGCGYLSPRPSRSIMGMYYPREFYWSWEGQSGAVDWKSIVEMRSSQLVEKSKWLHDLPPGRLLDMGAQKGEFLWYMQQQGWSVEGVELDDSVPNPGNMPIRYGDFLDMHFEENQFDAITYWAVLEHVYEPAQFFEKAARLLKPGGRLVAVVTNFNSIQSRFYQADDYPRHLTIFTKGSVQWLCKNHNLRLTKVHTGQEIFGGSLNGGLLYLVKRIFGYSQDEALSEWKQFKEPDRFWCQWRGSNSALVRNVSRIDRVLTYPLEKLLDKLGYGLILSFAAEKPRNGNA